MPETAQANLVTRQGAVRAWLQRYAWRQGQLAFHESVGAAGIPRICSIQEWEMNSGAQLAFHESAADAICLRWRCAQC